MKKIAFLLAIIEVVTAQPIYAEDYAFTGIHYVASYKECSSSALRNVQALQNAVLKAADASGATVLDKNAFIFDPDGLTMVVLLSESHASIHTYPEHNACFVDLFTCGENCSHEAFEKVLTTYLSPKNVEKIAFVRK